jgi:hypothetical protein
MTVLCLSSDWLAVSRLAGEQTTAIEHGRAHVSVPGLKPSQEREDRGRIRSAQTVSDR